MRAAQLACSNYLSLSEREIGCIDLTRDDDEAERATLRIVPLRLSCDARTSFPCAVRASRGTRAWCAFYRQVLLGFINKDRISANSEYSIECGTLFRVASAWRALFVLASEWNESMPAMLTPTRTLVWI